MPVSRREVFRMIGGTCSALAASRIAGAGGTGGLFLPTRSSLHSYRVPEWFRDAKFGIWSHWGAQSAIAHGGWCARSMYMQGSDEYNYHVRTFGHPSKVGYKDLVNTWSADKWEPSHLALASHMESG